MKSYTTQAATHQLKHFTEYIVETWINARFNGITWPLSCWSVFQMKVRPGSNASSETQGQLVGTGKSLNGREKNSGEEKSSRRVRAPGDKVLTDQFQTVGAVLASDWCQKIFVFFLSNAVLHAHEPNRMQMGKKTFIRFGSCEVRRLTPA